MLAISVAVSLAALALVPPVVGQLNAPDCQTGWEWSFNSLGQNPCTVTAYLNAICNSGSFSIPPLEPNHHYIGPDGPDNGDLCKCNTVAYSLISACDACQGNAWTQWSEWSLNCTQVAPDGVFPEAIPSGTKVPHWAYLNVTVTDTWNNVTAFNARGGAESTATGGPTVINPSSSTAGSSPALTPTSNPSSEAGAHKSSNHTGAIAGGVVGGVVGLALIGGLIAFFLIRRRRTRVPPSAAYATGGPNMATAGNSASMPFMQDQPATPKRFYDPSDPSTFPTSPSPSSPTIHTTNQTYNSQHNLSPNRNDYNGFPEI